MAKIQLLQGDCLDLIHEIPDGAVDIVLTDPPYSSGGQWAGDRKASTGKKYCSNEYNGSARFQDFSGDNMDQRAYSEFLRKILRDCRKKTKPEGVIAVFIDWRNLPLVTDVLQMAGWVWRGIVVWDKGRSRPTPQRFRNDCEYIVWGTNGPRGLENKDEREKAFIGPGCYHIPSVSTKNKHHQTEKPVALLEKLLEIAPHGGTVLDPFMGSGSTGVACVNMGLDFIGAELDPGYFQTSQERIADAEKAKADNTIT